MNPSQLLTLPAKKFTAPTTSGQLFTWHDCLIPKVQDSGLSGWKGLLTSHHRFTTPVLYHQGSWLVRLGQDPEFDGQRPDGSPTDGQSSVTYTDSSHNTETIAGSETFPNGFILFKSAFFDLGSSVWKNYGGAYGVRGGIARVPNAVLIDRITLGNPVPTLEGMAGFLEGKGVFAGSLDANVTTSRAPWLVGPFPPTATRQVSAGNGTITQVDVSAANWAGGNLLFLVGVTLGGWGAVKGSPLTPGTPDPNTWYYSTGLPYTLPDPSTTPVVPAEDPPAPAIALNSTQFAYDQAQVAACYPNFNRFRMIAYLLTPADTSHIVPSEASVLQGFNGSLGRYGVVVKGPYAHGQSLRSTIQDDVREFFQ